MLGSRVNSQNHAVCSDAFAHSDFGLTCNMDTVMYQSNQQEFWITFGATSCSMDFTVENASMDAATVDYVVLYKNGCINLTAVDSVPVLSYPSTISWSGLDTGAQYYIKMHRNLIADCVENICNDEEYLGFCIVERMIGYGVGWTGNQFPDECPEQVDPLGNSIPCTTYVCVNEEVQFYTMENLVQGYSGDYHIIYWDLPGSNIGSYTGNWYTPYVGTAGAVFWPVAGTYNCYWDSPCGHVDFVVVVSPGPPTSVSFDLDAQLICPGSTVEVQNVTSTGSDIIYDITVSPGMPVTGNIIGPFPAAANGSTYDVTVTASNGCGSISQTQSVLVDYQLGFETEVRCDKVIVTPDSPCEAAANWTYEWDFGDGSPVITSGFGSVAHAYANPGFYTITLMAVDNTSFPGINLGITSEVAQVDGIPTVEFSLNESCGEVFFVNSTRCDAYITNWHWDFGDGTVSSGQIPVPNPHVYSANGTYTVTLIATHSNGQVYNQTQTITVTTFPVPPILEGPTRLCCSDLTFSVLNGTYDDYYWSFSDPQWNGNIVNNGTSTVSIIPPPEVDKITLCVTVLDENRCEATACIELSNADCCPGVVLTDPENGSSPQVNPTDVIVETSFCGEIYLSTLLDVNGVALAPYYDASGKYIYINHDLIIDVDATILNANIRVLGGHEITVQDGVSFSMDNCVVQAKCSKVMWRGISLQASGSVLQMSNSTVKHAERAVQSNAGALFDVANSNFINNWVGIQVNILSISHTGTIQGSVFTTNAMLFPPHSGYYEGFAGINLNGVPDIHIGSATINGGNSFSNMQTGIRGNASGARIYNNVFHGFGNPSSSITSQKGIYFVSRIISRQLFVGGSAVLQPNTFNNVNIGIHTDGRMNTSIVENNFNEIYNYGIWLTRNMPGSLASGSHWVEKNDFKTQQGEIAIWAQDNNNTLITIDRNVINDYSNFIEQGILVSNTVANTTNPNVLVQVTNNRIRQALLGIGLINVPRVYAAFNRPQVNVTNANLNATGLTYTGIRMENCLEGELDGNQVSRVGGLPVSEHQLTGIWVESSMMAYVHENTVEGWGKGIAAQDNNLNSRLYCNTLRKNWNGFYFTNAVIGDQGEDPALNPPFGLASDNRWIANQGADRMDGNLLAPSTWYYRPGGLYFPQTIISLITNQLLGSQAISECGAGGGPGGGIRTPGATIRQQYFKEVAQGVNTHVQHTVDHQYWERTSTFRVFDIENFWLNVDPADDSLYQHFYSVEDFGNQGILLNAELEFIEMDSASLLTQCNQVSGACNKENLLMLIYQLAAQDYLKDSVSFTSTDSLWLYNLACSDPLTEGQAVFAARSLLGLPFGCLNDNPNRSSNEFHNSVKEPENSLIVYPNPANNELNLVSSVTIDYVKVFDGSGRLVMQQSGSSGNNLQLDIAALNSGIYFLEVTLVSGQEIIRFSK